MLSSQLLLQACVVAYSAARMPEAVPGRYFNDVSLIIVFEDDREWEGQDSRASKVRLHGCRARWYPDTIWSSHFFNDELVQISQLWYGLVEAQII